MKRGRGQQIRIDLYDTIENKYVLRDSGMPDAARHLKIPYKTFMNYIYKDKPVQGIYKVIKVGILPSKTYLAEQAAIERAIVKKEKY
jgi:hypothetical protein